MRVAPVAHAGMLLGFIVVTRRPDGEPFTETEDTVLTEIARQIGLALHNVQLDTALQASLDELQVRNQELQDSRARIVAAGDAERRKLERNLHDGAQQHLVALAVKLRLAHDAVEDDPDDAMAMIDEIKSRRADGDRRAAGTGARDLPAAAGVGRSVRGAARGGGPRGAADDGRTRRRRSLRQRHRGGRVLLHARSAAERRQARRRRCDGNGPRVARPTASCGSRSATTAPDSMPARRRRSDGHGFVNMADRLGAFGGTVDGRVGTRRRHHDHRHDPPAPAHA